MGVLPVRVSLVAALLLALAGGAPAASPAPPSCTVRAPAAYTARVMRALRSGQDVWGNELLARPGGPTYDAASRYLAPLLFAGASGQTPLTASGVYYVPFGPALHVADGSQVIARRAGGRALTVVVAGERYGSCLRHLGPARLADGGLPVLQTTYRGYAQESFTTPDGTTFVHVTPSARFNGVAGEYVSWAGGAPKLVDSSAYDAARRGVVDHWVRRLRDGASIETPERRVNDALRATLVQNLELTWRYSFGNAYEQFSFPEGLDVAQVMTEYGFADVARSILRVSLTRRPVPYPNWKMGEKLLGWASYARLTRDEASLAQATPTLRSYVAILRAKMTASGLLRRERFSSDIEDQVFGLHSQAVVWQGLNAIAAAWERMGLRSDAMRARTLAARLERGLRRAVAESQQGLPDGSLFVPMRLLDDERPYASVIESRAGSYWNLVAPYAFASGILSDAQERGALRYMLRHGSRLLGLVRAGAYALYGRDADFPVSGTDQVYGINAARFLADRGEAAQLVLSLYGTLAAAMTPGTFVAGEAASLAPIDGRLHRSMYLPPNAASNAAFLETLRSLLLHETADGLELAFATPRPWLRPGKRIVVQDMPTSFGPVSYSIETTPASVRVTVDMPSRAPRTVKLRLRFPRATRTLDLSGRKGHVELGLGYPPRSS
jgi:hypothetical protein